MATITHNPTFKVPTSAPPRSYRSPSPPRAFIEPLSPSRPQAIEPLFNYPPVTSSEQIRNPFAAPTSTLSRPRAHSVQQAGGHERTPSTIDALAEAALVAGPSYEFNAQKGTHNAYQYRKTYAHGHPTPHYGSNESPHKRARSEVLRAPHDTGYIPRPATSYGPGQAQGGPSEAINGYDSRVEEAALLLNFRTGGFLSNHASPPIVPASLHRPHANSFPQDSHHSHHHGLPPASSALPPLVSPVFEQPAQAVRLVREPIPEVNLHDLSEQARAVPHQTPGNVSARLGKDADGVAVNEKPKRAPQGKAAESPADLSTQAPDAPKRRGWPKGKPRGSGAKKSIVEKASKRGSSRKKGTEQIKRAKASQELDQDSIASIAVRRKSMGDMPTPVLRPQLADPAKHRAVSVPPDNPMIIREALSTKVNKRQSKAGPDITCAACATSRESAATSNELDEWISCNGCKGWFHIDCAGFKKAIEIRDVDKYFCAGCEPEHGKTTYVRKSSRAHVSVDYAELQRGVLKTSEESVEHHYIQPIKDGTFTFDEEQFPRLRPEMVTREFFEKSGVFVEPICIPAAWNPRPWEEKTGKSSDFAESPEQVTPSGQAVDAVTTDLNMQDFEYDVDEDDGQDKLDMVMPEGLTVRQVCELVGPDTPLDVIDVKTQNSGSKWTLKRWADYYEDDGEEKTIRNVISLEVSQTKLGRLLRRPRVVRDIDLQDSVWPQEETAKGKWPKVQFYCLMSVADSFTDFHVDFGGSSVYYHILRGKKTFFFIPPKPKHLKAYEEWNNNPQQNFTFLPDITKECYRVDLHAGDTMLIPSGWIHAVWTPETSLVIGGNFLTRMSYKNQFRVAEVEKANRTPMKFRYPYFQRIMWYSVIEYLQTDPLPQEVSQLFYEGHQYDRRIPIWQDFDGDVAADDTRAGAYNARYYSQAELDGLPELLAFIHRTVMLAAGQIEGTSADQQKRVNASIPKGYGEPLEIAKAFALWTAWKRGNETPPPWANADFQLAASKPDPAGVQKKLTGRALKEHERKEAFAAWRVAPDRQSQRVMSKTAAVEAQQVKEQETEGPASLANQMDGASGGPALLKSSTSTSSTPDHAPPPRRASILHTLSSPRRARHQTPSIAHQIIATTESTDADMMELLPGQHYSTPKTSVLGPKRVACDTCRKRRIRCKHKDVVTLASNEDLQQLVNGFHHHTNQFDGLAGAFGQDHSDNITVSGARQGSPNGPYVTNDQELGQGYSVSDHASNADGSPRPNGQGPLPGTNAYISANIPMTMNGVAIFGEVGKRGRSKACFECRKSKRRCVHDESGNVDPVKAAETPVPRGSQQSKKRSLDGDGSPSGAVKKFKPAPSQQIIQAPYHAPAPVHTASTFNSHVGTPAFQSNIRPPTTDHQQQQQHLPRTSHNPTQPPIDPDLFTMFTEPTATVDFAGQGVPYPVTVQQSQAYHLQSLEQIANEVLDMNGRHHDEHSGFAVNGQAAPPIGARMETKDADDSGESSDGLSKPDGSVDSGVYLPSVGTVDGASPPSVDDNKPSQEITEAEDSQAGRIDQQTTDETKVEAKGIPLYRPPGPPSQSPSPELMKRQPNLFGINIDQAMQSGSVKVNAVDPIDTSNNAGPGTMIGSEAVDGERRTVVEETEDERLARLLQQEERGLRRRG